METTGQPTYQAKNVLTYDDIDQTTSDFIDYFTNDFLPYFPEDALIDKARAVKLAKQMYQAKGTPASFQFLFRVLYNSDVDIFYTRDAVLRASDGIWYVPKSVKLSSTDPNFLNIKNLRLFGETTKSIATVENTVFASGKTEVFISNIERLFQSGEYVRVVDNNNQPVLFNGNILRAKIVGQISQITVNPTHRGLLYQAGNPVVVYGGLDSPTGNGAVAVIGSTTTGSIQRINVLNGGYGYRPNPNTVLNITNAPTAVAIVGSVNTDPALEANVTFAVHDTISLKRFITIGNTNYDFSNVAISNANTTLVNAFSFMSFPTYPISSVIVENGGGGISKLPVCTADSIYQTDVGTNADVEAIGILAPIQIINGGNGYVANDRINIIGGSGYGAHANVTSVAANGQILSVSYVNANDGTYFPLGGMGYTPTGLPTLSVSSANVAAANAVLSVPGVLGSGATFSLIVDRIGSITTINIEQYGEDYIAAPNVSLKIQDIAVSNVSIVNLPVKQDLVYQGANTQFSTYLGSVDSITLLSPDANPANSIYNLRVYNYNGAANVHQQLTANGKNIHLNIVTTYPGYDANGTITYGDGTALATASFKNGLVIGQGSYLSTQGQLSSFSVLESADYNNFTYRLTVEKEIAKYRDTLLNLLHPSGMKVVGVFAMKANNSVDPDIQNALDVGYYLEHYTGANSSGCNMVTSFTNKSNNVLNFTNLSGANLANIIFANSTTITVTPPQGPTVHGLAIAVDSTNNTVTLDSNTWLTFGNVANITANAGSNTINITSLTGSYNVINMGDYSNTAYPLMDIVYVGDLVLIGNNTQQVVTNIDYVGGIITVANNWASNSISQMSVSHTMTAYDSQIKLYGPVGTQYFPELTTETGDTLTTESGLLILLD